METWPTSFPLPSTAYTVDSAANTVRTQMESGTIRSRLRSTQEKTMVNVTWEMNDREFTVFAAYVKHKLLNGSAWFKITLALGNGMVEHTARFVDGNYQHAYVPVAHWNVNAQLEIEERKVISNDILDIYISVGFSDTLLKNFLDTIERARIVTYETMPDLLT